MRLDGISVELRPRSRWEAIDLGFAMARHWLWPIYRTWLAVTIPLFLLLNLVCWQAPWLAGLILWWLKPLLDRIPLYVLSRALFGVVPTLREALRALPGELRPQWLAALTWLRFSPTRSFWLPVVQLERLRGREQRRRITVLDQPGGSGAGWLTLTCLNLELVLYFALFALSGMAFPEFVELDLANLRDWLTEQSRWEEYAHNAVYLIAFSLIEPFYVAAGFALYLNRRTLLEAWDIEIGFRRLAERLHKGLYGAALLVVVWLLMPLPAQSAASDEAVISEACQRLFDERRRLRESPSEVKRALAEVLAEDKFPRCEKSLRWHKEERPQQRRDRGLDRLAEGLAGAIRGLLWGVFAVFAALLIIWMVKRSNAARGLAPKRQGASLPPAVEQGRETAPEPFACDAAQQAWRLWQAGEQRAALSLLYRATLNGLGERYRVDFGASATEEEALGMATAQLTAGELIDFLRRLTRAWQSLAYAHRAPSDSDVEDLCRRWPGYFKAREA